MKRLLSFGKSAYVALAVLYLYVPMLVLIAYSFNDSKLRGNWTGFTTKWYEALFSDPFILNSLWYTLAIATVAAVISTIFGTAAAIAIKNLKKWPQAAVMQMTYVPVINPEIVTGVSLMMLFQAIHVQDAFIRLVLAHIAFDIPYVILSVMPKLSQMNPHLMEAALDLGATPTTALRRVVLPEIMPGIISGFIMAFTLSMDDFVISYFCCGEGIQPLSVTIYSMARKGVQPTIYALSAIIFVIVLLVLVSVNVRNWKKNKKTPIHV